MKYRFTTSYLAIALSLQLTVALATFFQSSARADEQQRWTGHIDNQAYLDRYYGRKPQSVSTYAGGSSTGYSHRPGYGGVTTIVIDKPRQRSSFGVEYRSGSSSFIYYDGYRPNYYRKYYRGHVKPRPYYKHSYPRYKNHFYYRHGKPNYGKPYYKKPHRPVYVAPGHPGYKSRHYYKKNRYPGPHRVHRNHR